MVVIYRVYCRWKLALCNWLGRGLTSREHTSGYVRCPCKGREMGCLWLLLKPKTGGDQWYEIHRPWRPFRNQLADAVAQYIIDDLRPYSTIQSKSFWAMLMTFELWYDLPSRNILVRDTHPIYVLSRVSNTYIRRRMGGTHQWWMDLASAWPLLELLSKRIPIRKNRLRQFKELLQTYFQMVNHLASHHLYHLPA